MATATGKEWSNTKTASMTKSGNDNKPVLPGICENRWQASVASG